MCAHCGLCARPSCDASHIVHRFVQTRFTSLVAHIVDDQCVLIDCKEKELPGEQSVQQFLKVVLKQCYTHTMQAGLLSMENATTGSRHAVSFTVCTNDSGGKNLNVCDWGNCNTLMTMVQSTAITADIESDYDFVYCDFPDCCTTWLCPPEKKLKFCKILMLKTRNLMTH